MTGSEWFEIVGDMEGMLLLSLKAVVLSPPYPCVTGLICNEVTRGLVTSKKRKTKAQLRKTLLTIGPITLPFLVFSHHIGGLAKAFSLCDARGSNFNQCNL